MSPLSPHHFLLPLFLLLFKAGHLTSPFSQGRYRGLRLAL